MACWKERSLNNLRSFSAEKNPSSCTESSSTLLQKKESIEKKLALLLNESKRIQKELQNTKHDDEESFILYKCQLYELITNITWDLHSLPDEVKGYVSIPLNIFNMNTEVQSSYDIAKELWELISGEVEPLCASP